MHPGGLDTKARNTPQVLVDIIYKIDEKYKTKMPNKIRTRFDVRRNE